MPCSSKIYDLLTELAQASPARDLFEFAEETRAKEIESFAIWRPGPGPGRGQASAGMT